MTLEGEPSRGLDPAAEFTPAGDLNRAERILGEQVRLLAQSTFAAPSNAINAAIVAAVLSDGFPVLARLLWVAAAIVVVAGRMALRRRFRRAAAYSTAGRPAAARRRAAGWARLFVVG